VLVVLFDDSRQHINKVLTALSEYVDGAPDTLVGEVLPSASVLCDRLDSQRLLELRDLQASRHKYQELAARFSKLNFGSVLLAGLTVQGRSIGFLALVSTRTRALQRKRES